MAKANRNILKEPFTNEGIMKFVEELKKLEKSYFERLVGLTFKKAQDMVPSRSGKLKDSGTLSDTANYRTGEAFSITYNTPYAYSLHEGAGMSQEELEASGQYPYKAYNEGYYRQGKWVGPPKKSSKVKNKPQDGYKLYDKYYKPVKINGGWRSIDQTTVNYEGANWVQKSWENVLSGEDSLAQKILPKTLKIKKLETD
jgi:hypothetical protein